MSDITWSTVQIALGDLIEWEGNPVQLTERDADEIHRSLEKFGLIIPLVANAPLADGRRQLIDGHQRKHVMEYSRIAGPETLQDVRVPNRMLTEQERKEIAIRLRKNTGDFDFDALANNFTMEELLDWGMDEKELMGFAPPPGFIGGPVGPFEQVPAEVQSSQVRMVQLYLTVETQPEFIQICQDLSKQYGTNNITDTVWECVKNAHNQLVE